MALSNVTINIENGALGGLLTLNDGLSGLICTGVSVTGKLVLGTVYTVTSLKNAEDILGITEANNPLLYGHIKDYFLALNAGATLYILPLAATVTMEHMLDDTKGYVKQLQDKAQGKIRLLAVSRKSATGVTLADGLDSDVDKALIKGHATALAYRAKMQPFRFIVDGKDFTGVVSDLKDYNTAEYNTGSIFLCNHSENKNNRVGLILGGLSALDVQRKISRVKNGPVPITEHPYIGSDTVDGMIDQWDSLHDKGYVFLRSFAGKSGYFFSSDRSATATTDDYSTFSNGRVIDKALLIAYTTYVNELNEEILLDDSGKIPVGLIKSYEAGIEGAITRNMNEAISSVTATIDPDQNIISTGQLEVSLAIIPVGYQSEIIVSLGLENPQNS